MEKIRDFIDEKIRGLGKEYDLNDMISIEFAQNNELWLHISDVKEMSLSEKINLLRSGLRFLAEILEDSDEFKDIDIISGTSWIVTKNPGLLKRLGFTIDNSAPGFEKSKGEYYSKNRYRDKDTKDIDPSYAYITRDKFLGLYGPQNKT